MEKIKAISTTSRRHSSFMLALPMFDHGESFTKVAMNATGGVHDGCRESDKSLTTI